MRHYRLSLKADDLPGEYNRLSYLILQVDHWILEILDVSDGSSMRSKSESLLKKLDLECPARRAVREQRGSMRIFDYNALIREKKEVRYFCRSAARSKKRKTFEDFAGRKASGLYKTFTKSFTAPGFACRTVRSKLYSNYILIS